MQSAQTHRHPGGTFLGFPLEGFSVFQSLLLVFTSTFFAFFATTTIAIFSLLAWNLIGHHSTNYADSYLYVGLDGESTVQRINLTLPIKGVDLSIPLPGGRFVVAPAHFNDGVVVRAADRFFVVESGREVR